MQLLELIEHYGKDAAAKELRMTAPTLRKRLARMAEALGGPAVSTLKNGRLTPTGKAVLRLWREMGPAVEALLEEVHRLSNQMEIRVAVMELVWQTEAAWLESEFTARMPRARIMPVFIDHCRKIESMVHDGAADVGIDIFPKTPSLARIELQTYSYEEMVLVVQYDHAVRLWQEASVVSVNPAQIRSLQRPLLLADEHREMQERVREHVRAMSVEPQFLSTIKEILTSVSQDSGISILPDNLITEAFDAGAVDKLGLNSNFRRPIGIYYSQQNLKMEAVTALCQCFQERSKRPQKWTVRA